MHIICIIFLNLIIPNTFWSDSRYICCQETQGQTKSSATKKAARRLSSVGGVVCHSWLSPVEFFYFFFLTHFFIYLLCLNWFFYEAATSKASQASKHARTRWLDPQKGGYITEGKSQAHFHPLNSCTHYGVHE